MSKRNPISVFSTHEVLNQPPPLENYNVYLQDRALCEAVQREGAAWTQDILSSFGEIVGSDRVIHLADLANRHPPELHSFDRYGQRIDEVEYHPAYHELMSLAMSHQVHSIAWNTNNRGGGHVAHAALLFLLGQAEPGVCCPVAMTNASVPTLRHHPEVASTWEPLVLSNEYDERFVPVNEKRGATIGMAMTEKQGGSDVRANATFAHPLNTDDVVGAYTLRGHKWFCSAPMSDAFLTLAYSTNGLSCFLVPRWRPDGSRNHIFIQRLKDKLGNRSNASGEIEYHDAWARMVGEEGHGVRTIIEMVHHTRLDAAVAAAALMRHALTHAIHHAAHRSAFQKLLIQQPLMRNVLADLALECEAATALVMRVARSFDESIRDETARRFNRIATAVTKYWINKRTPGVVCEALECHGGLGYVEESVMPRLYREAPLNSIWEGSGNVICLDVLRTIEKQPDSLDTLLGELESARGGDRRLDHAIDRLKQLLNDRTEREIQGRYLVEQIALTLQGALLVKHSTAAVADAFCASRLGHASGRVYGTLPLGLDLDAIIAHARPAV
ncbi:MAG: isovaleryl-CoA dehydrogenase [Gammaproteobacteria bacterium]|nr:isovaleryl-CoA dehydrogenase [Gammaproteobacteria bacterium]